jgi:phage host-nuclease inhibitor protein Gam
VKSDPEVEAQPDREDNEDESEDSSEEEVVASTEIASLAKAAASGCRKCKNELKTGEKTSKGHDDTCPLKWRSVGCSHKTQSKKHVLIHTREESEDESEDDGEEEVAYIAVTYLAEAAASGCK